MHAELVCVQIVAFLPSVYQITLRRSCLTLYPGSEGFILMATEWKAIVPTNPAS